MTTEKKAVPLGDRIKAVALSLKDGTDRLVGRAIPGPWMSTAFAGVCLVAALLLIALIFRGSPDPGEELKLREEQVAGLEQHVQDRTAELDSEKTRATAAERELGRAKSQVASLETAAKRNETQIATLNQQIETLRNERREIDRQMAQAMREKRDLERARERAETSQAVEARKAEQLQARLDALTAQHNELKAAQDFAAKANEAARVAFEEIIGFANAIDVPERRIEALERHRRERRLVLDGTVYMARLDEAVAREMRVIEDVRRREALVARREAKDAYADYMRRLKMTPDTAETVELLEKAREELAGTDYEVTVFRQLESHRTKLRQERARAAYVEVTSRIAEQPREFEANLALLKEAVEPTRDTRWGRAIDKQVAARTRSLADDIGRAAFDDFVAAQRASPRAYDELIALGEELAPRTAGSRHEAAFAKRLDAVKSARLEAIGAAALAEARQLVAERAGEHEANIDALTRFKEAAAGSSHERSIDALITREQRLLARRR